MSAGASFLLSVILWFTVDQTQGLYVGIWVPSILTAGVLTLRLIKAKTNRRKAGSLFFLAGILSFLLSVSLYFLVDESQGLYVGLWVPTVLALGVFFLDDLEGEIL
jgi:hypothetical protein